MENRNQEKVFSKMMRASGKNYFFDVKKANNGSNYLIIAESYKKRTGEQVTNRIMIFKDHFDEFSMELAEAREYLK